VEGSRVSGIGARPKYGGVEEFGAGLYKWGNVMGLGSGKKARNDNPRRLSYSPAMTAMQVIEEIKSLDAEERAKVLSSLLELEAEQRAASVSEAEFQRVADSVFDRHHELMRKLAQ